MAETIKLALKDLPRTNEILKEFRKWQDETEPQVAQMAAKAQALGHETGCWWNKLFLSAQSEGAIPPFLRFKDHDMELTDKDETLILKPNPDESRDMPIAMKKILGLALVGAMNGGKDMVDDALARMENEGGVQTIH